MCCSSSSPAAQFAQSYSPSAMVKAMQNPMADKNHNGIPDIDEKKASVATNAPGTGVLIDKSA